ncbi:hypothetical protein ACOSP6_06110 [Tenacibaculum sp. MEBiC06402]|uniref:hypothetical protein n=1 Tax=unclassified Tenacibaculum TaxID=2635139 RepID=UPI003B9A5E24
MMEDKKIERLFQEKLKDFEVEPSSFVWDNIENKLTNKKKRRVLPIWWFTSGIASFIILGLLLFPKIDKVNNDIQTEVNSNKSNEVISTDNIITEVKIQNKSTENKEFIKNKPTSSSQHKYTGSRENLMVSKKIEMYERRLAKSTVSLKGLQVDKKIAMENVFTELLVFKTQDLGKEDFIAEINKKEDNNKEDFEDSNWSISPVVGILSSQSFSKSSSIDAGLNENEISNPGTLSYGVSITFDINEKLSIKSGIQFQNMSYNTENVGIVSSTTISNNLENIDFNGTDNFLYVSTSDQSFIEDLGLTSFGTISEGTIEQDINYMEFPVELKYKLFTFSKFQTSLISGFSTLFLTDNSITTRTSTFSREIGEANNLNKLNFSANLGLDVEFNINEKVRFNINPMFKTQLNTFSDNSTNFRPYIIGVYSGFRYNF